jgi:hypothetical protein
MIQAASKLADDMMGKNKVSMGTTRSAESETETMKDVVSLGKKKVGVEDKPKPVLTHELDVIVRVRLALLRKCVRRLQASAVRFSLLVSTVRFSGVADVRESRPPRKFL